ENFVRHADRLFAAAPLRAVHIRRLSTPPVPAFAACPHLAWVEALDLGGGVVLEQVVCDVLASPHLTRLTELSLAGDGVEWPTAQALARSGLLGRLTRLDLSNNHGFGDRAARALVAAPAARGLRDLNLSGTNLTPWGVGDLLAAGGLGGLRRL